MAKTGPETRLLKKMRAAGSARYGSDFVSIKQHGNEYSEVGVSDLLCCLFGVFVAVEVKAPESYGDSVERAVLKGPTVKQRLFIKRIIEAGGVAGVAASVEQFMALLEKAESRTKRDIRNRVV